jgi:hypothetical protein
METKYGFDSVLRISATPTLLPVVPALEAAEEPAAEEPVAVATAADAPAADEPAAEVPAAEVAAPAALVVPPAAGVLLLDEQAASPTAAVTARPTAPIRWAPLCLGLLVRSADVTRIGSLLSPYRTNRSG